MKFKNVFRIISTAKLFLVGLSYMLAHPAASQACYQAPAAPVCQVQLYYHPVLEGPVYVGNHSFWYQAAYDGNSGALLADSVIDGGPSNPQCLQHPCNLVAWETLGQVSSQYPDDNIATATLDSETFGFGSDACTPAGALDIYPSIWMSQPLIPYLSPPWNTTFQNSNTFAHRAGDYAGLSLQAPPPDAWGW